MTSQINKIILKSLETGDKYGLEIIKDIQDFTNGRLILKQPSLYSALRRMEKKGLISSFWEDSEIGGRRHYYSLTKSGKEILKADNVVSESDIQSVLSEVNKEIATANTHSIKGVNAPVLKNKATFECFDPRENLGKDRSFTQQIRNSSEPATIQEKTVAKSEPNPVVAQPKPSKPQQSESTNSFWRESLIKEETQPQDNDEFEFKLRDGNKPSRFDINYKDILGDLDADKPEEKSDYPTPTVIETKASERTLQQQRAKEYSNEISKLFASNKTKQPEKTTITKEQEELRNAIFKRQNQETLEEINRRYNLDEENVQKTETNQSDLNENYSNFTKVSPSDIQIKRYVQNNENVSGGEKEFLNINKLILTRSIITAFFYVMAVLISYFVFNERNFIYAPHYCIYWIALGAVVVYLGIVLAITLSNFNKKIQIKRVNWFINLFYRALIAIALFTFVIAMCLCFGMTNFLQIEYFTIWYLSALAVGGIFVSWALGYIIYSTKSFRE